MLMHSNGDRFSEAFKICVVTEIERGKISKNLASRKYDILGHSTIDKWCKKYGHPNWTISPKIKDKIMDKADHELMLLANENKFLKQELEASKMKNLVFETLIDIAEKEFGIPIRKKYGVKQLEK